MAGIVEPLRPPRVLSEPKRFAPLRNFCCGRKGSRWESLVNTWVKDLYRGLEKDQTIVVLEDAQRSLIGICSFKPQTVVAGTSVGKDAQRIHMLATDRLYHGQRLDDGSRPSDVLLEGTLEQIRIVCGGRLPSVSTLVSVGNDRSHALFERHGFKALPYVGEGEVIRLRRPEKRLSLVRLRFR